MRIILLILFGFFLHSFEIANAEVLTGEMENPGYDPLFWVSANSDCPVIEAESAKRYGNVNNTLIKSEFDAVSVEICALGKGCNLSWCNNSKLSKKENTSSANEFSSLAEDPLDLKLEIQSKADLAKIFKERKLLWQTNLDRAIKVEQLGNLSWQKLEMPFSSSNNHYQAPVIKNVGAPMDLNVNKGVPMSNSNQLNLPSKKDKYFNILKK